MANGEKTMRRLGSTFCKINKAMCVCPSTQCRPYTVSQKYAMRRHSVTVSPTWLHVNGVSFLIARNTGQKNRKKERKKIAEREKMVSFMVKRWMFRIVLCKQNHRDDRHVKQHRYMQKHMLLAFIYCRNIIIATGWWWWSFVRPRSGLVCFYIVLPRTCTSIILFAV